MQDQFKLTQSQDIKCHSETSLTQDPNIEEQFYEIPSLSKFKGFAGAYDFMLPFALHHEENEEDADEKQSQPLNFTRTQSFQSFQFDFVRGSDKFGFETHLYIYYNMCDQKRQLESAIKLYSMGMQLHRQLLIWAKCSRRGHWTYFDTKQWKKMSLPITTKKQDYFTVQELKQALKQL